MAHSRSPSADSGTGMQPDTPAVRLELLLVSGQRWTQTLAGDLTVSAAKTQIWTKWPADGVERPEQPERLRLLHLGRFLEDSLQLSDASLKLPIRPFSAAARSQPTVVHVVVRPPRDTAIEEKRMTSEQPAVKLDSHVAPPQETVPADGEVSGCRCTIC